MNEYIVNAVIEKYGFNPLVANKEKLEEVEEIVARDVTGLDKTDIWDFSAFPKLKKIDCGANGILSINVKNNPLLEEIKWDGVRGRSLKSIDFSNNPNLRIIEGGQDGMVELDLSNNSAIEQIELWLNYSMRWLNISKCNKLKRIVLKGILIPFVDLTDCTNLEYVDINYWNTFAQKYNEYGDGYPRPIIFVNSDFDEKVIPLYSRRDSNFAYYLVRVLPHSDEAKLLNELKSNKDKMLSIYADRYGRNVAYEHYRIIEKIKNIQHKPISKIIIVDDELPF